MPFHYVTTEQAQTAEGLRAIVVGGVPSPWGEAMKGIFHVKGLEWQAVYLDQKDPSQGKWAGEVSAPVVFWKDEAPVVDAPGILNLAERLAPAPSLVPQAHAQAIHDAVIRFAGPGGLGWQRRLQQVHAGLNGEAGFHPKIAQYLGFKYGYTPEAGQAAEDEVCRLLESFAEMLPEDGYYFGDQLTAVDIYSAAFMALFAPLAEPDCAMHPATRAVFEQRSAAVNDALDPKLLKHRDRIHATYLELPLQL